MYFTPYALPALLALLAKAGMFFYARYSRVHNLQTRLYLLFLFSLSVQNLAELIFFRAKLDGSHTPPTVVGLVYFSASIFAIALFLHLALIVATEWRGRNHNLPLGALTLLYSPMIVLQGLLLSGSLIVAGFQPLNYTYTKIPGPLYFLFEIYAIGYLAASVGLFAYGAYTQKTTFQRLQNKLLLAGLLPAAALVIAVIVLQRFNFRGFNTTATLPLATTFFLAISAYATHQYRLFDVEFFLPWSKIRKRKTEFYKRIQALITEIAEMSSVSKIVQSLSQALRCPVVFLGGPKPALAMAGEALGIARFPLDELKKIDHVVVANEIAQAMPDTYALMKRHKVAAVVPFHPHSQSAASWMLLGEGFSEQVYSPLDFKMVDALFDRIAGHFLDNQALLREQLTEAQQEMGVLHRRLANAWAHLDTARKELKAVADENRVLKQKNADLLRSSLATVQADMLESVPAEKRTLDEHVAEFEARLIATVLERCNDDPDRAAEILGIPTVALYSKIRRCEVAGY